MADIAAFHEIGDGADRLLDRNFRIDPGRTVDIDMILAKSLQGIGERGFDRRRPRIESNEIASGIPLGTELHAPR